MSSPHQLFCTVTSPAGTVNEGTETFTVLKGSTVIGNMVTVNVANGTASANYGLPADLGQDTYTIQAVYNGTVNFAGSSDTGHSLVVDAGPFGWQVLDPNLPGLQEWPRPGVAVTATRLTPG